MKRLMTIGFACAITMVAVSMPTRKDLAKAQDMVKDVTSADIKALKAGTKKPAEVAAVHMELAGKSESEAEKYLLLQSAFNLYAKTGDYDSAANALEAMCRDITDINPDVIIEIYNKAISRSMKERAPRLYAIKESAREAAANRRRLPALEKAAKANPQDATAQRVLGECLAELGHWDAALAAFAKADGEVARIAKAEADGAAKPQELADFWWDYKSDSNAFRIHAAVFYRSALTDGEFKGLSRERAENRVKEMESDNGVVIGAVASRGLEKKQSVAVAAKAPKTRQPLDFDLGKGIKLKLAHCPAGKFRMSNAPGGPNEKGTHEVKITRAYWIAPTCVTREMYKVFEADYDKDEKAKGEKKPTDFVKGRARAEAFAGWLNEKFKGKLPSGYVFRLPTEAEWEFAQCSGAFAKSWEFEGTLDTVQAVSKKANPWRFENSVMDYAALEVDPVRVYDLNAAWVCRQGGDKRFLLPLGGEAAFRLVVGPDLLAEKK